jgi:transcriptional regulator with XRE-family HTH domain
METIGARIRRLRLERGLSQREISGPGATYAYISRLEAGQRGPSLKTLRVIAAKLGVLAEYLERGRNETATDDLAQRAFKMTDGALWIVLTGDGVTLSWQEAGDRYQLDRPGENLTEALLVALDRVGELARLDAEEERIRFRRDEIARQWAAPE